MTFSALDHRRIGVLGGDARGGLPLISYQYLKKSSIAADSLLNSLFDFLDHGQYIFADLDFKGYDQDAAKKHEHNVLIHGADLDKGEIELLGYNSLDRTFTKYESSKTALHSSNFYPVDASLSAQDIVLLHPNQANLSFCGEGLKIQLMDYLNSTISLDHFDVYFYKQELGDPEKNGNSYCDAWYDTHARGYYSYGLETYNYPLDYLTEYIKMTERPDIHEAGWFDLRIFKCVLEHKIMMAKRWEYIQEKKYLDFPLDPFIMTAREIENKARIMFGLLIKNSISRIFRKDFLLRAHSIITEIKALEENYLSKIADSL